MMQSYSQEYGSCSLYRVHRVYRIFLRDNRHVKQIQCNTYDNIHENATHIRTYISNTLPYVAVHLIFLAVKTLLSSSSLCLSHCTLIYSAMPSSFSPQYLFTIIFFLRLPLDNRISTQSNPLPFLLPLSLPLP